MPLTIRDAESAYLEARAAVETWQAEFLQQWLQPELDLAFIQFWQGLDPMMKEYLRQTQPAAYNQVEALVQQVKERYTHGPSR